MKILSIFVAFLENMNFTIATAHAVCNAEQHRVVAKRFIPATHTEGGLGRAKGASPVRIPTWNTTYYCTVVADALFQ